MHFVSLCCLAQRKELLFALCHIKYQIFVRVKLVVAAARAYYVSTMDRAATSFARSALHRAILESFGANWCVYFGARLTRKR